MYKVSLSPRIANMRVTHAVLPSIVFCENTVTMAVAETVAAAPLANINPPPQLYLKDSPKEEWTMFKRLFNNYTLITRLNRQEKPY